MELLAAVGRAPAAAGKKPPPSRTRQPPCGAEPGGVGAVEIPPGSCFFYLFFFYFLFFLKAILCLPRWSLLMRMHLWCTPGGRLSGDVLVAPRGGQQGPPPRPLLPPFGPGDGEGEKQDSVRPPPWGGQDQSSPILSTSPVHPRGAGARFPRARCLPRSPRTQGNSLGAFSLRFNLLPTISGADSHAYEMAFPSPACCGDMGGCVCAG